MVAELGDIFPDRNNVRVIPDERLNGKKMAEMYEGDNEVRVSTALYELLSSSDRDAVLKKLKVKILPAKPAKEGGPGKN